MSPQPSSTTQVPFGLVTYWYHVDSSTAMLRRTSSERSHLHAAHWKISSVVPLKCPSTRGRSQRSQRFRYVPSTRERGRILNEDATELAEGIVWFARRFS